MNSIIITDLTAARPPEITELFSNICKITDKLYVHPFFSNSYIYETSDGLLLIDPGLATASEKLYTEIRAITPARIHSAVYTHGHIDHCLGLTHFYEKGERVTNIIAQERCNARFERYRLTRGLNTAINRRQFSNNSFDFPEHFQAPTITFRDELSMRIGDTQCQFFAGMGETDDACITFLPQEKILFTGDFVIWSVPNCGNPQKVQRYPNEWINALEMMAGLNAKILCPGHGYILIGEENIRQLLTEMAQYLRVIVDQVIVMLNDGASHEEIFHRVKPDDELSQRPYLKPVYDDPKFIVRNLLRLYSGWWNGDASQLLPATPVEQACEIVTLAGGIGALVERAKLLLLTGKSKLAAHLIEFAVTADPSHLDAQRLKCEVYEKRISEESSLMSKGIYRAAINDAKKALGE